MRGTNCRYIRDERSGYKHIGTNSTTLMSEVISMAAPADPATRSTTATTGTWALRSIVIPRWYVPRATAGRLYFFVVFDLWDPNSADGTNVDPTLALPDCLSRWPTYVDQLFGAHRCRVRISWDNEPSSGPVLQEVQREIP